MQKYCEKCGNKLCDGGDVCLKCGRVISKVNLKAKKKNVNIFNSFLLPIIIIIFLMFLPFIWVFGFWLFLDFDYSIQCKSEYGKNYYLVHGDEVEGGDYSGHYCCVKGKSKNTDYCEFVGW